MKTVTLTFSGGAVAHLVYHHADSPESLKFEGSSTPQYFREILLRTESGAAGRVAASLAADLGQTVTVTEEGTAPQPIR
jgi:hypothetical protein